MRAVKLKNNFVWHSFIRGAALLLELVRPAMALRGVSDHLWYCQTIILFSRFGFSFVNVDLNLKRTLPFY